jgi:CelD/BcsL family acetyltransferase involved in cellulose biosynthesis
MVQDAIDDVADEWDALADAIGASPFLRPGWFSLWASCFGKAELALVTVRRDGRLAGVAPLMRHGEALIGLTNEHTPAFDLIGADDEAKLELARAVLSLRPVRVTLDYLEAEDAGARALRRASQESSYRVAVRDWERPPYVEISGDWESYEQRLDGKMRRDLARRRRRLDEVGAVSLEVLDGTAGLDELLAHGFALEPSGWKSVRGTAVLSSSETSDFYTRLARWAVERGALRLSFLRSGEQRVAFQFGLEEAGSYYFLKGGYDPAFARFAPARLLLQDLIRRSFSVGLARFEFLGADESFKLEWTSMRRDLKRVEAFAPSFASVAAWAAVVYGRPVARKLRALVRVAQQPRAKAKA